MQVKFTNYRSLHYAKQAGKAIETKHGNDKKSEKVSSAHV